MEETGAFCMEDWRRNEREQFVFILNSIKML